MLDEVCTGFGEQRKAIKVFVHSENLLDNLPASTVEKLQCCTLYHAIAAIYLIV